MQSQGRPTLISIVIWSIVASLMTGCGGGGGGGGGGPVAQRITITAQLPADGAVETVASAWVTITGETFSPVVQEMTYNAVNHSAAIAITVPVGTNYKVKVDAKTSANVIVYTGEGTGVKVVSGVPLELAIPMVKPPEAAPDTIAPVLSNATVTPSVMPKEGGIVALSVNATDEVGVTSAKAVVTLPDTSTETVPLTDSGTGTWTGTYTAAANDTSEDQSYTVAFTANDVAGNKSDPVVVTFTVPLTPDTVAPVLSNATVEPPVLPKEGGIVALSVVATDDTGVASAKAVVTLPDNGLVTVALSDDGKGTWIGTYTAPGNPTLENQSYTVTFTANDDEGNKSNLVQTTFMVPLTPDTVAPALSNATVEPSELPKEGGIVALSVDATDNVRVTSANAVVTLPDNNTVMVSLTDNGSGTWTGAYTAVVNDTSEDQGYSVAFTGQDEASNVSNPIVMTFAVQGPTGIDYSNLTLLRTYTGHPREVRSVDFSPDGAWLASGCEYGNVKVWDPLTGYTLWTKAGGGNWCLSVAFSPDGNTLASASMEYAEDSTIKLWGAETGVKKLTLTGHRGYVYSVAFSPDGSTLASGSIDFTVKLWDPQTGVEKRTLTGHDTAVRSVAFSPDGTTLASTSQRSLYFDAFLKLWNVQTGELIWTVTGPLTGDVAFSPDGTTLVCRGENDELKLVDVQTGLEKSTIARHEGVISLAFSPDGSTLASGSWSNLVKLWDVQTGVLKKTLLGHTGGIYDVAFSPDGRMLATGSHDHTVKIWRVP